MCFSRKVRFSKEQEMIIRDLVKNLEYHLNKSVKLSYEANPDDSDDSFSIDQLISTLKPTFQDEFIAKNLKRKEFYTRSLEEANFAREVNNKIIQVWPGGDKFTTLMVNGLLNWSLIITNGIKLSNIWINPNPLSQENISTRKRILVENRTLSADCDTSIAAAIEQLKKSTGITLNITD